MYLCYASQYMLRLLMTLAQNGSRPMTAAKLAQATGKSKSSVEVYMKQAIRGGLCKSVMGPTGGYRLAKSPTKINMDMVVKEADKASRIKSSKTEPNWCPARVKKELGDTLSDITLEDLLS